MEEIISKKVCAGLRTVYDHFPKIAAIDLGTNSCRLTVASINIVALHDNYLNFLFNNRKINIIETFSRIVFLGEDLYSTGELSEAAIKRAINALLSCKRKMDIYNIITYKAVATEACRKAKNKEYFLKRVLNETGIKLQIISEEEEAELVLSGCISSIKKTTKNLFAIDIGGGSTELIWSTIPKETYSKLSSTNKYINFNIIDSLSIPFGVITINELFKNQKNDFKIFNDVQNEIRLKTISFIKKNEINKNLKYDFKNFDFLASSGTVMNLAIISLGIKRYDPSFVDGKLFCTLKLSSICKSIFINYIFNSHNKLKSSLYNLFGEKGNVIYQDRNEESLKFFETKESMLACGSIIFDTIISEVGMKHIIATDKGVRDGVLKEITLSLQKKMMAA